MEPLDTSLRASAQNLNKLALPEFARFLRQSGHPRRLIELARDEDLADPMHDWTGELMFSRGERRRVRMRARDAGIVAGIEFLPDLIECFAERATIEWESQVADAQTIEPGTVLAEFVGDARAIVRLERTMLNLISRMSGIASRTRSFVALVEGTKAAICDTRKTTPGLRAFEKYAVRCGGGTTPRMGLFDAVLIKDNHLAGVEHEDIASRIKDGLDRIRRDGASLSFVQVEVDTLDQLARVLDIEPGVVDIVLLDNMRTGELAKAVSMRDHQAMGVLLEASGGVSESSVVEIARTGVDRISIGSLTHQAQSLDIGLDAV